MVDEAGATARRELMHQTRELLTAMRLFKSQMATQAPAVPPGTLMILSTISDLDGPAMSGCHVKDLATRHFLDPSTVSRAVAALVKAGLVARVADPADGRASVLQLTSHGREALAALNGWLDDRFASALADWTPEDLALLKALIQRFSADLMTSYNHPMEAAR
jgi:DNA-binding MarR family transcriptional regulator